MGGRHLVSLALACALLSTAAAQTTYFFEKDSYDALEEDGYVSVCMRREGSVADDIDIAVEVTGGDADVGDDFDTIDAFSFEQGRTFYCLRIDIVDDNDEEGTETLTIAISSDVTTKDPDSTTITIHDDGADQVYYWEDDDYDVVESSNGISVCMRREGDTPERTIQVTYNGNGDASMTSDYTPVSAWEFLSGSSRQCETIRIINDVNGEDDESFSITIDSSDGVEVRNPDTTIVTIEDDDEDDTYYWEQSAYPATESSRSVEICMMRSGSNAIARTIQVNYASGSADLAVDFNTGSSFYFDFVTSRVCRDVTIIDDEDDEDPETFTVSILNTGNVGITIGNPSTTTVTITDDDDAESIGWNTPSTSFLESAGTVSVTVTKTGTSRAVTATVTASSGTALIGSDFQLATVSVYIPAQQTSATFPLTILDDDEDENSETFTLVLASTTSDVTVSRSAITVTITDNDVPTPAPSGADRLSDGEIAGIVVGVIGLVIIIIIIVIIIYYLMNPDSSSGDFLSKLGSLIGLSQPKPPPPQLQLAPPPQLAPSMLGSQLQANPFVGSQLQANPFVGSQLQANPFAAQAATPGLDFFL